MKMKVMMRIDVIERQSRGLESSELRLDLRRKLSARCASQRDVDTRFAEVGVQSSSSVDEIRDPLGRQRRRSIDEHEVQTDP